MPKTRRNYWDLREDAGDEMAAACKRRKLGLSQAFRQDNLVPTGSYSCGRYSRGTIGTGTDASYVRLKHSQCGHINNPFVWLTAWRTISTTMLGPKYESPKAHDYAASSPLTCAACGSAPTSLETSAEDNDLRTHRNNKATFHRQPPQHR
ncbi:hypothetical protein BDW02DRAFT_579798 [Decorospora gaudefroyi]|uniref:Uncharacterized protein n=1 Tax=Decorospora gaudefroyi TaxID=184978 RepID=A0A6A5KEU2_9PLEO|nr:hypothetical protein BDW02DRAFT_579798 [Decorospora gaudefroyi]